MGIHRSTRSAVRLGALFVVLAIGLVLAGCGSKTADSAPPSTTTTITLLDTHKVALSIKASILAQKHVRAHVVCPEGVTQGKGLNFVCSATVLKATKTVPAGTTQFAVQQTDSNGHVTYAAGK
jgi:hypothetical protein